MSTVAATLAGKHLFVTGATGFVGKVWLSHVLAFVPDIGRVTLLVRPTRRKSGLQRMAEMVDSSPAFRPLKDLWHDQLAAQLDARIDVVEGDVASPMCGVSPEVRAQLAQSVDLTLHIAGLTDFQPDPKLGVPANLEGAAHVADLVETFRSRKLVHTSTCFVAGTAQGETPETLTVGVSPNGTRIDLAATCEALSRVARQPGTAAERIDAAMVYANQLGWPNLYTATKGLSEHLLASRPGLDLTIARPSVVECARTWPMPGWNEGLNTSAPIMWFCGTAFPQLPSTDRHIFDIIPVDAVARGLTVICARHLRDEAHPVYQLASGDHNPATFARIIELTALGHRRYARRGGAALIERAVAHIDVRPGRFDPDHPFHPKGAERALSGVRTFLEAAHEKPGWIGRIARRVPERIKRARREVTRQHRAMVQLQRMLELYRPFIHDHDWRYHTVNLRQAMAELGPEDAAFHDDLADLNWRRYWLDVQFPGIARWCFPILDGREAPTDPPSDPPLVLGLSAARLQGAA